MNILEIKSRSESSVHYVIESEKEEVRFNEHSQKQETLNLRSGSKHPSAETGDKLRAIMSDMVDCQARWEYGRGYQRFLDYLKSEGIATDNGYRIHKGCFNHRQ